MSSPHSVGEVNPVASDVTTNASLHAPPSTSSVLAGPSVAKATKSNLRAQISEKDWKLQIFKDLFKEMIKLIPCWHFWTEKLH